MSQAAGVVPHLVVTGGKKAIEFYQAAFGAEEVRVVPAEDGQRLMHAELNINGGKLYLCDDFPEYHEGKSNAPNGVYSCCLHLSVPDCDAAMARAAKAGGKITMPAWDSFWGDRYGKLIDPFGHEWSFSHPLKK